MWVYIAANVALAVPGLALTRWLFGLGTFKYQVRVPKVSRLPEPGRITLDSDYAGLV